MQKRDISLILVIVLSVILLFSYYSSIKEVKELNIDVRISTNPKELGFNVEGDALHFGTIPRGQTGVRHIKLFQDYSYPIKVVMILSKDEVSKWVTVSDNEFILEPNTTKDIKVTLFVPNDAKAGNYTGKLKVIFRKPLF